MSKYYVQLVNDELPAPLYVERGLGFGGVKLTGNIRDARRYDTEQEAEKIAALARAQKDKERGGECTTVEIVTEETDSDGWDTRFHFVQDATGAEARYEMKKTDHGIISRYVTVDGAISDEFAADQSDESWRKFIHAVGAWGMAKIKGARNSR